MATAIVLENITNNIKTMLRTYVAVIDDVFPAIH